MSVMRTFLITGSSRGIGLGLVEHLLRVSNSRVIATCRSPNTTTAFDQLIEKYSERLLVLTLDVNNESSFDSLKTQLIEKGVSTIDVLIANAGVTGERDTFQECELENLQSVFATNVFGPLLTYQTLSSMVTKSSSRLFVTISSQMGSITRTEEGHPRRTTSYAVPKICASYRMSKTCVNMLSVMLSRDPDISAAGCKVLCVHPGWVQTDMGGAGGRKADLSVDESVTGMVDIINRTIALQEEKSAPESVFSIDSSLSEEKAEVTSSTDSSVRKEFESVLLSGSNCVFVNYDGAVIPW